jgi:hypothetical protein
LGFDGRINYVGRIPIVFLKENGIFSETPTKNLDVWGKRGTHFKNNIFHR